VLKSDLSFQLVVVLLQHPSLAYRRAQYCLPLFLSSIGSSCVGFPTLAFRVLLSAVSSSYVEQLLIVNNKPFHSFQPMYRQIHLLQLVTITSRSVTSNATAATPVQSHM
jgi:hypothetical protein